METFFFVVDKKLHRVSDPHVHFVAFSNTLWRHFLPLDILCKIKYFWFAWTKTYSLKSNFFFCNFSLIQRFSHGNCLQQKWGKVNCWAKWSWRFWLLNAPRNLKKTNQHFACDNSEFIVLVLNFFSKSDFLCFLLAAQVFYSI